MSKTFCLTSLPSVDAAVEAASYSLYTKLVTQTLSSPVLLLLAGGSAVKMYTRVAALLRQTAPRLKNLTIAVEDERWPEKNNTSDIRKSSLIEVSTQLGATFLEVPTADSLTEAATSYAQVVEPVLSKPTTYVIAVVGMGGDGHILSVNPDSDRSHFADLFTGDRVFTGYESTASTAQFPKFPRRITLTLKGLEQVDYVISLVCGAEKAPVLQALQHPANHQVHNLPALSLLPMQGELFTDQLI